ncbi:MAG: hypothetical protein M1837_003557 [Sclerophora amabilis]|nr:MAG: hypothetical protein M1837_003557 [Sclerophora amabilis]
MGISILPPPYTPSPRKPSPPSRSRTLNIVPSQTRNRSLSVRSKKDNASTTGSTGQSAPKHRFTMASLRGIQQPELSKKLFKLIKSENHAINAYESAGRERLAIAAQLSDWGEATGDDAISDISDKLGVLMSELGEEESRYGENLEDYRAILKQIRNTESSVQPSRDLKNKISDEIQKLKYKEPQSAKLVQLEQELVRAEAQSLVAEAQLTNITRQKLKEAYDANFAATIERAEKQAILARHGRRLLNLLDDTPVVPGDTRPAFEQGHQARQILNDAEDDLRDYRPELEPVTSTATALEGNLMPAAAGNFATSSIGQTPPRVGSGGSPPGSRVTSRTHAITGGEDVHPAHRKGSTSQSPVRRVEQTPYTGSETDAQPVVI